MRGLVLVVTLVTVWSSALAGGDGTGAPGAQAGSGVSLSLDLDISDGACIDIDSALTADVSQNLFYAGVCLANPGAVPVAAFGYYVVYDDSVIVAPEVADQAPSVDDNPDANVGGTTFGTPTLGSGWACDGGVGAHPKGDMEAATGAGNGKAYSGGCGSAPGPNTLTSGVLGVITFNVLNVGTSTLALTTTVITDDNLAEIGSCNPAVDVPMVCSGATVEITEPPISCDNPFYANSDFDYRYVFGPNIQADRTWPMHDRIIDECDLDDDNDGISDEDESTGALCTGIVTGPWGVDTDGDHLTDGWECASLLDMDPANDSLPNDANSRKPGSGSADADNDRVPDIWEVRGYNARTDSTDSDNDACHDLVEVASVDGVRSATDADRLAVARRALNIWAPHPGQDWVLDVSKNGAVDDADRLFVARAVLLPDWQPKLCSD